MKKYGIKNLFEKEKSLSSDSIENVGKEVESERYIEAHLEDKERFIPFVDFNEPSNFSKFGLAEEYYEQSVKRVYKTFPYDGSLYEKLVWHNSSSYLDRFVFETHYPRTNGYIRFSAGGWTKAEDKGLGYGAPASASYEYILIKGGPNTGSYSLKKDMFPSTNEGDSNIYDLGKNRESNLKIDGNDGNTVEFWLRKAAFDTDKTEKEVIFDLMHSGTSASPINVHSTAYARCRVEISGHGAATTSDSPFYVTYMSGAGGYGSTQIGQNITVSDVVDGNWHHYAFVFKNSASTVETKLYIDGKCNHTILSGSTVDYLSGAMVATIGSLVEKPKTHTNYDGTNSIYSGDAVGRGWGKLSGSMDEFRFWKVARNPKEIGRHWRTHVGGGTNTDKANTHLGVYYKFNEGITTSSSLDSTILDYSGRLSNGSWVGYPGSTSRETGSAINDAGHGPEYLDPIIYSGHPDVVTTLDDLKAKGLEYDYKNNSAIYKGIPEWITTEDSEGDSNLKKLTQVISSYFDTLSLQISSLASIKDMQYSLDGYSTNNSVTGSSKPSPFADRLLENVGFLSSEIFADSSIIETVLSRNEKKYLEEKTHNVKNLIYHNIYNNILHIYKSKGTEKSLRNLFRCFGVDDELLKINIYADNTTYEIKDNYRYTTKKKKYINFFHSGSNYATVFQLTSSINPNSVGYISGTGEHITPSETGLNPGLGKGFSHTIEAEVVFPKYVTNHDSDEFYEPLSSENSLFGIREAQVDKGATQYAQSVTTWAAGDRASVQVYVVRETAGSNNAYFKLSSSVFNTELTSPVFKEVYDNQKWNFALKVRPSSSADWVSGAIHQGATLELYGAHATSDRIYQTFSASSNISNTDYDKFTKSAKRIFCGADRTNFTGTLVRPSDVKISSIRYWLTNLSNNDVDTHAKDPSNYGIENPYRNAYDTQSSVGDYYIPRAETLALHWDFENVTGSDSAGTFIVEDASSGSVKLASERYGWLGQILKNQHVGYGWGFPSSETNKVVDRNYLPAAKTTLPESINSSDMVSIRNEDDVMFTRESRPVTHFLSIEKSMYQTISEEMVNIFSSMKDYNNLIGEPVDYYRPSYKSMDKLRQLFFERVKNTPDLEKYVDFYKWVDSSINNMVQQLIPASAISSEGVRTVVEDHILTRSKYRAKFPATERKFSDPEGKVFGIGEKIYNWRLGHAPIEEFPISASMLYFVNESFDQSGLIASSSDPNHLPKGWDISANTTAVEPAAGWLSINGPTPSNYTGPTGAYDGDYYMYAETSGDNNPAKVFGLLSPIINKDKLVYSGSLPEGGPDMFGASFYYHMYGADIGILKVKAVTVGTVAPSSSDLPVTWDSTGTPVESNQLVGSQQGHSTSDWRRADIDLRDWSEKTFRLLFHYTGGGTYRGDAAIDLVQVSGTWIGKEGKTDDNCSWWDTRAERTNAYFWHNNDSSVTDFREQVRVIKNTHVTGTTFALRNFTKVYRLSTEKERSYHSGFNSTNKKIDYAKTALAASTVDFTTGSTYLEIVPHKDKICDDFDDLNKKTKLSSKVTNVASDDHFATGKGDLLLPFSLYETDVETGYNLKIKNNLSGAARGYMDDERPRNVDFTNLHHEATHHGEASLQGPFTEKYVGGMAHRHVSLLAGSNNQRTRPENWIITFVSGTARVEAPSSVNKDFPRSVFYRDQVAKRPINIKNIKQKTELDTNWAPAEKGTKIGNFDKEYQLVQTSGRALNSRWFAESDGAISSSVISTWVSGAFPEQKNGQEHSIQPSVVVDFALPNRGRHSHVFVERFSAPGGPEVNSRGYLDVFSEEYSPYNALPWRNLTVRRPLTRLLSKSCGQFGLDSTTDYTASYHKQHRNTSYRFELSTPNYSHGTVTTSSVRDNWYITRPIPQSDLQYAWITSSAEYVTGAFGPRQINAHRAPMGYQQPNHSYASNASTDIVFASSSHVGSFLDTHATEYRRYFGPDISAGLKDFMAVDFAGTNFIIYEPLTASANHLGYTYDPDAFPVIANANLTDYLHQPDTIYGYSTTYAGTKGLQNSANTPYGAKLFNALMLHRNGPYGWPTWKQIRTGNHPIVRTHKKENTYSYMLEEDFQNSVSSLFVEQLLTHGGAAGGVNVAYSEDKTPTNITLPPVTVRYKPIEHSVTSVSRIASDEISEEELDATPGIENTKKVSSTLKYTHGNNICYFPSRNDSQISDLLDDKIINYTSNHLKPVNKKGTLYDYITDDAIKGKKTLYFNAITYKETIFPKEVNTFLGKVRSRTDYTEVAGEGYKGFDRSPQFVNSFWRDSRANRLRTDGLARNSQGYAILSHSVTFKSIISDYDEMPDGGELSGTFRLWPLSRWPLDSQIAGGMGKASASQTGELWAYNQHEFAEQSNHMTTTQTMMQQTASQTYMYHQYFGTHVTGKITAPSVPPYYYHSASGQKDTVFNSRPLYLYHFRPQWRTAELSKKNPWYDSYDQFAEDIRPMAKDYSLIPEFKISEHMDYYVNTLKGNFKEKNNKYLTLKGASIPSGSIEESSEPLDDFYAIYSNSDFMKHFGVIKDDYGEATRISLTCKAIKKLLPYNGFYPVTRCLQLGEIFSQSYGEHMVTPVFANQSIDYEGAFEPLVNIGGSNTRLSFNTSQGYTSQDNKNKATDELGPSEQMRMQAILEPFFAPGIVYNTIKSGIAVDWPVITGSLSSPTVLTGTIETGYVGADGPARSDELLAQSWIWYDQAIRADTNGANDKYHYLAYRDPDAASATFRTALSQHHNFRFPFDSLLKPNLYFKQTIGPEARDINLVGGKNIANNRKFLRLTQLFKANGTYAQSAHVMWNGRSKENYRLAMHNFLAEVPRFFLKEGRMKTFASTKTGEIPFTVGTTYFMDVTLEKTDQMIMFEGPDWEFKDESEESTDEYLGHTFTGSCRGIHYGPACAVTSSTTGYYTSAGSIGKMYGGNSGGDALYRNMRDPAYCAYTPPYFYGPSTVRLTFTPELHPKDHATEYQAGDIVKYTIPEIIAGVQEELSRVGHKGLREAKLGTPAGGIGFNPDISASFSLAPLGNDVGTSGINTPLVPDENSMARKSQMKIDASINLFGQVAIKEFEYTNENGDLVPFLMKDPSNQEGLTSWVIGPHFECPILNFSGNAEGYHTRGMWMGYGETPEPDQGIYMRLAESFGPNKSGPYLETRNGVRLTGSLLAKCGFSYDPEHSSLGWMASRIPSERKLGEVAEFKEIREAVVAIPFVPSPATGEPKFIDIHPHLIRIAEGKETGEVGLSIRNMVDRMQRYVIPPRHNFLYNQAINPFVMYIFEFKHMLDRQDLKDIWQNVMPKIAMTAEEAEVTISHDLGPLEFFGTSETLDTGEPWNSGIIGAPPFVNQLLTSAQPKQVLDPDESGFNLPDNVRWMVYKVKQKAETNFYNTTIDNQDNDKFGVDLGYDSEKNRPDYSYNWPYDFFSLVELAKMEVQVDKVRSDTIVADAGILLPLAQKAQKAEKKSAQKAVKAVLPDEFMPDSNGNGGGGNGGGLPGGGGGGGFDGGAV